MFNKFIVCLDVKPSSWERRVALFCAYLVDRGNKSTTIKSYVSAIKCILKLTDKYVWNDSLLLLNSLTKTCRLINDKLYQRLPIKKGLLELLLFELERIFKDSEYNEILFKAIFVMAYYGLMRVSEIASEGNSVTDHAVKACNVFVATNKEKILLLLYSSKTHGAESPPQKIKITSSENYSGETVHFCRFKIFERYRQLRGTTCQSFNEDFFIFKHKTKLTQTAIRKVLNLALCNLGLNPKNYGFHSMRAGRATDMINLGYPIEVIKHIGRWKSNAVYRYIKC